MLSLYIENFISFYVIMLLLWFGFHRGSPRDTAAEIVPQIDMKYPSCLNPLYRKVAQMRRNFA